MGLGLRFEKRPLEKGIRRLVFWKRAYVFRIRPLVCRNGHYKWRQGVSKGRLYGQSLKRPSTIHVTREKSRKSRKKRLNLSRKHGIYFPAKRLSVCRGRASHRRHSCIRSGVCPLLFSNTFHANLNTACRTELSPRNWKLFSPGSKSEITQCRRSSRRNSDRSWIAEF